MQSPFGQVSGVGLGIRVGVGGTGDGGIWVGVSDGMTTGLGVGLEKARVAARQARDVKPNNASKIIGKNRFISTPQAGLLIVSRNCS